MRVRILGKLSWIVLSVAFSLSPTGDAVGAVHKKVLHVFLDKPAANPSGNLIFDAQGNLYGATSSGGNLACAEGCGTVFRLSRRADGGWEYKVIYKFAGQDDGAQPVGRLVFDSGGNLYGAYGYGYGGIFELISEPDGSWKENPIYSFKGPPDAGRPYSGLTIDSDGNLYGTTQSGGANGIGAVYELVPLMDGGWSESVIHSFSGDDGDYPWADVTIDQSGNVYGTTISGGTNGHGTVFVVTPSADGWTGKVLYSFKGGADHGEPAAGVFLDSSGILVGTLSDNGEGGAGAIFELTPSSDGTWQERLIHPCGAKKNDGGFPWSDLVPDANGNLYSTTWDGGLSDYGTIYELARTTKGYCETTVLNFDFADGANPANNPVTFDASGNLFVATNSGGLRPGYGVVLEIAP